MYDRNLIHQLDINRTTISYKPDGLEKKRCERKNNCPTDGNVRFMTHAVFSL